MLSYQHKTGLTQCDGISRREWLRVGGIGLGGGAPDEDHECALAGTSAI